MITIESIDIDEFGSFRTEHLCNLCAEKIKLDEQHTVIRSNVREDVKPIHLHLNCTIQLQVALTAQINLTRLPLRIAIRYDNPPPGEKEK